MKEKIKTADLTNCMYFCITYISNILKLSTLFWCVEVSFSFINLIFCLYVSGNVRVYLVIVPGKSPSTEKHHSEETTGAKIIKRIKYLYLFHLACPFSGVARANHGFQFQPVLCIFHSDSNYLHVLFYCIYKSPTSNFFASYLVAPSLAPFNQLIHCPSSAHVKTISIWPL